MTINQQQIHQEVTDIYDYIIALKAAISTVIRSRA